MIACVRAIVQQFKVSFLRHEPLVNAMTWHNWGKCQLWKWLWSIKMSRIIVCFRWLLVHKAIPVNGWRKGNVDRMCPFYMDLVEIAKHCLWSCGFAMNIQKQIITLLILVYPRAVYTWGAVLWVVVQINLWYMNKWRL